MYISNDAFKARDVLELCDNLQLLFWRFILLLHFWLLLLLQRAYSQILGNRITKGRHMYMKIWTKNYQLCNFFLHDHNNEKNVWTWKLVLILLWFHYKDIGTSKGSKKTLLTIWYQNEYSGSSGFFRFSLIH